MGKIKIGRWMSAKEFNKLTSGIELVNNNKFAHCKCESEGFCFFKADENIIGQFNIYDSMRWLSGIVSDKSILVIFEAEEDGLKKSIGTYANPMGWDCIDAVEYCVDAYSIDTMTILEYGYGRERAIDTPQMYKYAY